MFKSLFFLALYFLLLPFIAAAEDGEYVNDLELHGYGFAPVTAPVNSYLLQFDWKFSFQKKITDDMKFNFKMNYVADPYNLSATERNFFDIPEFNFKFRTENSTFRFGSEIVNWGVTDGYNPLDIINTRNYFDPLHSRKLGAFTAGWNYQYDWFESDLIYIPKARSPQLPGTSSRWLPRDVYNSQSPAQNLKLLLPTSVVYDYLYSPQLGNADESNLGLRLQAHLSNLDLGLYFYDGIAPVPAITPIVTGTVLQVAPVQIIQVDPNITLKIRNYRQKTAGFSFLKTFSSWQLKGATAYTQPDSDATSLVNWSLESVLAFEKQFSPSPDAQIIAIAQYSSVKRPSNSGNDLSSIAHFFDSNLMLGAHYMWRDTQTLTAFFAYDFLWKSNLTELKYEYHLSDKSKVGGSLDSLDGPADSPIGTYSNNKNMSLFYQFTF